MRAQNPENRILSLSLAHFSDQSGGKTDLAEARVDAELGYPADGAVGGVSLAGGEDVANEVVGMLDADIDRVGVRGGWGAVVGEEPRGHADVAA